jgi:hypothetical protein
MNAAIVFIIILFGLLLLCLVVKINYTSLESFENINTILEDICQTEKDNGVPQGTYGCYNAGNTGHTGNQSIPIPNQPYHIPQQHIPMSRQLYTMSQIPMPMQPYPMPPQQPRPKTEEDIAMIDILQLLKQSLVSLNNGNFKNYFNSPPNSYNIPSTGSTGSTGPSYTTGSTGSTGPSYSKHDDDSVTNKNLYMLKSECIRNTHNYPDRSVTQGADGGNTNNNQTTDDSNAPYPMLPDFTSFGI